MPVAQMTPETESLRISKIQRAEASNYLVEWLSKSAFLTLKYGLIDGELELSQMSTLEPNWDSYGANPPSARSIEAARTALLELASSLILPSTIVPSSGGG